MRWVRIAGAVLIGLAAAVVLQPDRPDPLPPLRTIGARQPQIRWVDVHRAADAAKPGAGRSVMGQRMMTQEPRTSGPSAEVLRFRFDAPVEITGVVVSVDISGPQLVEVVAGVNISHPYGIAEAGGPFVGRDWLLHTSDTNLGGPSKIDEQIVLPVPVALDAGDWVSVSAWLGNHTETAQGISPEVIVFYRWL